MNELTGKTALVTGGSRGIGRAICLELAARGANVALCYAGGEAAAAETARLCEEQGAKALAIRCDVSDGAQVKAMVDETVRAFGGLDILVNNAGISYAGLFQDMTDDDWDRCLAVNLTGARNMARAVLPHMLHEKAGAIVNISSIWGLRGASCEVGYACSKAGIVALTRSLALELAPSHIRVNAVAPGCIDTDMVRVLDRDTVDSLIEETPLGRLGRPEDIAQAVVFLASEKASFITGQVLAVDGGFATV